MLDAIERIADRLDQLPSDSTEANFYWAVLGMMADEVVQLQSGDIQLVHSTTQGVVDGVCQTIYRCSIAGQNVDLFRIQGGPWKTFDEFFSPDELNDSLAITY